MRSFLYVALVARAIVAHPVQPAFSNEINAHRRPLQGPLQVESHGTTDPWDCSEGRQWPTMVPWTDRPTALPTPQPLTSATPSTISSPARPVIPTKTGSPSTSIASTTSATSHSSKAVATSSASPDPPVVSITSSTTQTSQTVTTTSTPSSPTVSSIVSTTAQDSLTATTASVPSDPPAVSTSRRTSSSLVVAPATPDASSVAAASSTSPETSNGSTPPSGASSTVSLVTTLSRTHSVPAGSTTTGASSSYKSYCGDGSVAQGWPAMSQWRSFDDLFEVNTPNMLASCAQWGVTDDSATEVANLKKAIQEVSSLTKVDARFILAIVMQESTGCVRVITTNYAHLNPGLMQSWDGTGSCNRNQAPLGYGGTSASNVTTPCPYSEIHQMIMDGTNGTSAPDSGLRENYAQQGLPGAAGYYRTAKIYNGGLASFQANKNSLQSGCCTTSYASDIANRLTGWFDNAEREFSC